MERRKLGRTGMEVSILGFGGAEIGSGVDAATVDRLLGGALDAGLNIIDTAECYGDSEELIGKAVSHRRQDYFLFTKCGHKAGLSGADWDLRTLEESIDRSLRRLRTDCVDLIQLHSCSREMLEQGDVVQVLVKAREKGKTRFIGYSGDREAALYAVESGVFDTLQTSLNIADQEPLGTTLPKAEERGMGVIAKRPLANAAWKREPAAGAYARPYWERLQKLRYPFLESDGPDAAGIALRFTLSSPGVGTAIVGTTNPGRWRENAALLAAGPLPERQYEAIRARFQEVAGPDWTGQT
jgi:aryl-alcohol dehydrogenase-like predicted oxidoreductase